MAKSDHPSAEIVPLRDDGMHMSTLVQQVFREQERRLLLFLRARLGSLAEAEDARQAVFLRLCERSATLRNENIVALLFVMARNLATDLLRARARQGHGLADPDGAELVEDEAPSADRIIAARDDVVLIGRILEELPHKCRTAFIRHRFEDASYPDIAAELGVSESMSRKYVLRAIAHCSARIAELEGWV